MGGEGVIRLVARSWNALRCAALRGRNSLPTARCGPLGTRGLAPFTRNGLWRHFVMPFTRNLCAVSVPSDRCVGRPAVGRIGRGFVVMCVMSEIFCVTESGTEPAEGQGVG